MSFSFTVIKATRADAREAIKVEFDKIVASQPLHNLDRAEAADAALALINLLPDDATRDLVVAVSGSIMTDESQQPYSVSLSINAHRQVRRESGTTTA